MTAAAATIQSIYQRNGGNAQSPQLRSVDHGWTDILTCRCEARFLTSLVLVSDKSQRRAARSVVADYHHAQLEELVARVGEAVDRHRAGELDAFDVDQVLFQYSRAAKELWKFCNYLEVEVAAAMIREQSPHDWWERGAPSKR
jgi:hypothetical protein